jgi:hypothetical protein
MRLATIEALVRSCATRDGLESSPHVALACISIARRGNAAARRRPAQACAFRVMGLHLHSLSQRTSWRRVFRRGPRDQELGDCALFTTSATSPEGGGTGYRYDLVCIT